MVQIVSIYTRNRGRLTAGRLHSINLVTLLRCGSSQLFVFLLCLFGVVNCGQPGPPYTPSEALTTFKIEEGFRIEVFASEPMIVDPVAMEFDEHGRVFVVEMPGYPLNIGATGRVKLLEDTDQDGFPDRSTIFVDGLVLPTGVLRWKDGILVTDAPNVWYFEDTDGDNRADLRKAVLTGFALSNPQHTVSTPVYGLDNWIYLANEPAIRTIVFQDKFGDPGSKKRFPNRSDGPQLDSSTGNLRFRPDTFELEALSGISQFGLSFDRWGRQILVTNGRHIRQEVIAAAYLGRNPSLRTASPVADIPDHTTRVYPITHNPEHRILTGPGNFTSACGISIYLGGLFRPPFDQASFVAEPAHNLVHCDVLKENGVTLRASRSGEEAEFLASTDSWFRPVNLYTGPDGALYVVDYYRRIVEHPEWMSDEFHSQDSGPQVLYEGSQQGRIYRITPASEEPVPLVRDFPLGKASDPDLVEYLNHPNVWWRMHAQRLLVGRQSAGAIDRLIEIATGGSRPESRVHALWTLEGLGILDASLIQTALEDPVPGIRENAIRLAEPGLAAAPGLAERLLAMTGDAHPRVRFQLLCTLGWVDSPGARNARRQLLMRDIDDEWMQIAALSAAGVRPLDLFDTSLAEFGDEASKERIAFIRRIAAMVAAGPGHSGVRQLLRKVASAKRPGSDWWRAAALEGLVQGIGQGSKSAAEGLSSNLLLGLYQASTLPVQRATLQLLELMEKPLSPAPEPLIRDLLDRIEDQAADPALRADSVRLLALFGVNSRFAHLSSLLDPQEPPEVQTAAVRALGQIEGIESGRLFISKWRELTPPVRLAATVALLSRPEFVELLVAGIENEAVPFWTINQGHKIRLVMQEDAAIRLRVHELLRKLEGERLRVLEQYRAALSLSGDAVQGAQVFKQNCDKCHQIEGVGGRFGPDLGTVRHRSREELLTNIMLPSQSISDNYELYVIELNNRVLHEGVIGSQTPASVTLLREDGSETVIARENIRRMFSSAVSGMPEGLEEEISVQEMAHLLSFLTTSSVPPIQ